MQKFKTLGFYPLILHATHYKLYKYIYLKVDLLIALVFVMCEQQIRDLAKYFGVFNLLCRQVSSEEIIFWPNVGEVNGQHRFIQYFRWNLIIAEVNSNITLWTWCVDECWRGAIQKIPAMHVSKFWVSNAGNTRYILGKRDETRKVIISSGDRN